MVSISMELYRASAPSKPLRRRPAAGRKTAVRRKPDRWRRLAAYGTALSFLSTIGALTAFEMHTSAIQAKVFSRLAGQMTYHLGLGPSETIRFPRDGPYDRRLGYVDLPRFIATLQDAGYSIESQARISELLDWHLEHGGIAPYHVEAQAGLTLLDRDGVPIFSARHPQTLYESYESVPPLVVETLLFIENRELLKPATSVANPAVEWDRLAGALADLVAKNTLFHTSGNSAGGSTLVTQMEKFRHSPQGRTRNAAEKLRQMLSASLRSYLNGPDTTTVRKGIVLDYLNATPLAARAGYGEIFGLNDGLRIWFGADPEAVRQVLLPQAGGSSDLTRRGLAYRQVLGLLLGQRRPSELLITKRDSLHRLTDAYLRLLAEAGVIDTPLRDAALGQRLRFRDLHPPVPLSVSEASRKIAATLRARLLTQLGLGSFYDLDRLQLTVETALDRAVQERVTERLKTLAEPAVLAELGLAGPRLIEHGPPEDVVYSFLLFERGKDRNYLRVQADNSDDPLDVNEGTWLDLGSTAKLRSLVTYLEVIAELYAELRDQPAEILRAKANGSDPLTRWVATRLATGRETGLVEVLEAAMQRSYSANPNERFFTGGGIHRFANYDRRDNHRILTVAEAFRNSVNLVFIRLMRDIVRYHVARNKIAHGDPLAVGSPLRYDYLRRFADREGTAYLQRFYGRSGESEHSEILARLVERTRRMPVRLTVVFRSLLPQADPETLNEFLRAQLPDNTLTEADVASLYARYARESYSLNDRAYIAGLHPLELWLGEHLVKHPNATFAEVVAASSPVRQEAYSWLFKTSRRKAQDKRIHILLEEEAFARIGERWQKLGYPFAAMVPSYASAIGSSGDRPAALAEMIGIIVSDGLKLPTARFERLHFARDTPFETVMRLDTAPDTRVLVPEVAQRLREALIDTVEKGTGKRVSGAFRGADGNVLPVGGKTGTGDHRYERFGRGGGLLESRVVNRTATFVFFLGDRFYGTVSAHVPGAAAADYRFTSALPTQLLKALAPDLQPILERAEPWDSARLSVPASP